MAAGLAGASTWRCGDGERDPVIAEGAAPPASERRTHAVRFEAMRRRAR
jgi:hypothetical protein